MLASPVQQGSLQSGAISELVSVRAQDVCRNSQTGAVGLAILLREGAGS